MLALLPPFGPRSSSATSLSRLLSHIGTLTHSRIEHTPKSSITRTCNTYLTQIHVLHVGSNASVFLSLSPSLFFFPWSRFNTFPPPSSPLSFEFLHRIGNQSLYLPFLLPLPSYVHPTTRSVLVLRKKKRGGGGRKGCFLRGSLSSSHPTVRHRTKALATLLPTVPRCKSFQLLQRQPNKCPTPTPCSPTLRPRSLHSANSARVHR